MSLVKQNVGVFADVARTNELGVAVPHVFVRDVYQLDPVLLHELEGGRQVVKLLHLQFWVLVPFRRQNNVNKRRLSGGQWVQWLGDGAMSKNGD
jgi:hypothetical protein